MKKLLTLTMIAVALIAFSCNRAEEGQELSGPKAKVTYTVAGPEGVATKAMGTIGSAYTLYYEVRLWDGTTLGGKLAGEGLSGSKDVASDAWPVSVEFDLARNLQYKVLFWAQSKTAPEGLYTISEENGLKDVSVDYSKMVANNENCDVFAGFDVIIPDGPTAANVTLERPLALLNLGTGDAPQYNTASGGLTVGNVSATVTGLLATKFNVAEGTAGAGVETEFTVAAAPIDANTASTLSVGEEHYNYLNAVYVLPAAGEGTLGVSYTIKDNKSANITSLAVTNVPVKSNYRTNIAGKLLTGATVYTVSVDQKFAGEKVKAVGKTFGSIAALNTYFASGLATGPLDADNGDIFPEQVIVTAIPDGDATTITLPKDTLSVAITILAQYDDAAGLTIAYPAGDKKTNNVYFNMAGLKKLTADLTSTHMEVTAGADIDLADVHTSTTTFVVRKGARVGTLNVQQGNANVAGEVETLNVPAGATADGTNPVEVFLAKESAVEKIVLNSKTDVVVEQPKDHIDVEATEKKVAVYVNAGAANSTATAQNGGVIYVEANVPCTVTADGTSEASSTVIIESGAAGSAVVAKDGGAIDLTANGDCLATADGVAEGQGSEPDTPSSVTINKVDAGVTVITDTVAEGVIEQSTEEGAIQGDVATYVAQNVQTSVKYISLKAAVDAASAGNTIKMIANSTETQEIDVTISLTIDLNGLAVTFAGESETLSSKFPNNSGFYVASSSDANLTISSSAKDGNENTIKGSISLNTLIQRSAFFLGNGTLTMKDIVLTKENTAKQSIYVENGKAVLDNLSITAIGGAGGIYLADNVIGTVTNCVINQSGSGSSPWLSSALAISDGAKIEVSGCSLTGVVPFFIFNSGGEAKLKNSSFTWIAGGAYGQKDIYLEYGTSTHDAVVYIYNDCVLSLGYNAIATPVGYSPYSSKAYVWFVNATDDALIVSKATELQYAIEKEWPLLQLGENATGNFVNGGVFNADPTACLAQDYKAVLDELTGHYSVIPDVKNCVLYTPGIEPVLSMNQPSVEYPDNSSNYEVSFNGQSFYLQLNRTEVTPVEYALEDAVNSAQAGQVIRLTSDVTVGSLAIPADVAIDFAGHTLTADQLSCKTSGGKFILKQSDQSNPYKVSFVGELEDAEIRGGSYLFDPTDYTPNGVGVVIPGQGEYDGGYYVPSVPEPKVFYANNEIVQQLGGLTIGKIPGTNNYNGWVLMYNPDGQRYNPYNTIGIQNGLYAFQADFNENENTTNAYENWYADYVIYYDKAVNYEQREIQEWNGPKTYDCPTAGLWGSYGGMTYAILMGENVPANYKCPLLGMVNWGWAYSRIRSDVKTFLCGPTNHSTVNVGTTATVELRLYKSQPTMEGINAPGYKDYITVGRYVHPLDDPSLTPGSDN